MNILTVYVAPAFIGVTVFLMSIAMSTRTGANETFGFIFGLASGILFAMGLVMWSRRSRNR